MTERMLALWMGEWLVTWSSYHLLPDCSLFFFSCPLSVDISWKKNIARSVDGGRPLSQQHVCDCMYSLFSIVVCPFQFCSCQLAVMGPLQRQIKCTQTNEEGSLYTNTLTRQQGHRMMLSVCLSHMNARPQPHCGASAAWQGGKPLTVSVVLDCLGLNTLTGYLNLLLPRQTCWQHLRPDVRDCMLSACGKKPPKKSRMNTAGCTSTRISAWQCLISSQTCTIRGETTGALFWSPWNEC